MAVSGDIQKFYYALALVAAGRRCYERHWTGVGPQTSDFGPQTSAVRICYTNELNPEI